VGLGEITGRLGFELSGICWGRGIPVRLGFELSRIGVGCGGREEKGEESKSNNPKLKGGEEKL